jgi:hypothetical protein
MQLLDRPYPRNNPNPNKQRSDILGKPSTAASEEYP